MRWNWVRVILHVDQRPKQNHTDENLPAHPQELYLLGKELGPMLNQENIQSPIMKCRRNWFVFFVMEVYLETTMAREMGSPRHVPNRRRRTREGPEPACVQTPARGGGTCRSIPPVSREGGRAAQKGWMVRVRQSSPIPAQASGQWSSKKILKTSKWHTRKQFSRFRFGTSY